MHGTMGRLQRDFYRTLGRSMVRGCTAIVPRSMSAKQHLISNGIPEEKISDIVHTGIDTQIFHPLNKELCRKRFGLDNGAHVIISAGRLHENKGMDLLIRAFHYIHNEDPAAHLLIKGNGAQELELRSLIAKLDLQDSVRIVTEHLSRDDMVSLYNCADLMAITSRTDFFHSPQ